MASILLREKRDDEALPYLDRALESNGGYTGAWHDKDEVLTRAGKRSSAWTERWRPGTRRR